MSTPSITMTSEEINVLIHSYLLDSGFTHSAFSLRAEGRLESSAHFGTFVPRGALVDLLSKALLYAEVEAHWRADAPACAAPFTLLTPHVCTRDAGKRKAPDDADARTEKRVRTGSAEPTPAPAPPRHDANYTRPMPPALNQAASSSSSPAVSKAVAAPHQRPVDGWAIRNCLGHNAEVFVCKWNPTKPDILASGDKAAVVNIWNIPPAPTDGSGPDAAAHWISPVHSAATSSAGMADLTAMDWSADGSLLAVASYDAVMRVLTADGDIYMSDPQHKGPVFASQFSRSGRWLLTGSLDGTACVWDVPARKLEMMYRCHIDCCLDVVWLAEDIFATCGADKLVNVLRIGDTKPLVTLSGHTNEVNQIKYHAGAQLLASCSDDRTARIWAVAGVLATPPTAGAADAANAPVVLRGHKNNISTVDWCPGAAAPLLLATTSFDGTARLWDSATGDCLKVFADHKTPVFAVAFSPDGRYLTTGGGDGWLIFYDVQAREKRWAWDVSDGQPDHTMLVGIGQLTKMVSKGIFEIHWQIDGERNRIAATLETKQVAIIDAKRIPELQYQ